MPEVAGSKWPVRTRTLWWSISKDSTTQRYNTELLWKPDWVGPFLEWQRRFDLTSEGYSWWCFIHWIICWVTQDIHTPLGWGNLSVRSPEEEQRNQTKYFIIQFLNPLFNLQWLVDRPLSRCFGEVQSFKSCQNKSQVKSQLFISKLQVKMQVLQVSEC